MSKERAGFAMQSFFIGVGAVIASMLPWILANWFNVSNEAPDGVNPDTVKWSFYLGAVVFLLAVGWTVLKSKEYSPEEMASFIENQEEGFKKENEDLSHIQERGKKQLRNGGLTLFFGSMLTFWLSRQELDKELFILSFGVMAVGVLLIIAA